MSNPVCFISYSWDDDSHKNWVRNLGVQLQSAGIKTYLDQWDLQLGMNVPQWIEESIASSDYILLICTPKFAERVNSMQGGVGQEKVIISGEMYYKLRPQTSFVPILREGNPPETAIPRYLGAAKWLGFRSNEDSQNAFEELLRHLYNSPKFTRPALGTKPSFLMSSTSSGSTEESEFSKLTETYQLSEIAHKWETANRCYYIVERLSDELIAMIRHPPLEIKRVDEPLRSFLLLAGLHHGGNWLYWLRVNLQSKHIISTLLTALTVSYDRVKFRAFYSLQFVYHTELLNVIDNNKSIVISKNIKAVIDQFVILKNVMPYLKEITQSDDNKLADKARAVIREIEDFSPNP